MNCNGCYKEGVEGFCSRCRSKLFDGRKISYVLPFDTPTDTNLAVFQEKTKRLSISGVQLKYSVRIEDGQIALTDSNGQYILKPIPPAQLAMLDQAPENEHLTMQIASQIFKIETAANGLVEFRDGVKAYITRRFDVDLAKGLRYPQEDFAQLSEKTKNTHGDHYKYNGTYEEIGKLIQKYIAASIPALERYFRIIVFNYLFSNGDAHLKNFSIIRTPYGDYSLTPAYDLMCTVLHTNLESDTALDLYEGDMEDEFYGKFGYYGRPHFLELARRIGIMPRRAGAIVVEMLGKQEMVLGMIRESFLSDEGKEKYEGYYLDKVRRFEAGS